jgi:hypothetical protein
MTAISIKTGHRFIVLPETITDGPKVTPLFAGMELIALASIKAALVRVTVGCSAGINLIPGLNRSFIGTFHLSHGPWTEAFWHL